MSTVISNDGTEIDFTKTGQGAALILVPGASQTRQDPGLDELARHLADRFTVYVYDRRGRGNSGDAETYEVAREIEDIAALIEDAGGEAYLFGMSSGAVLALHAAEAGLPIAKVALYEPPFVVDDSREPLPSTYREDLKALVAEGKRGDAAALFMTKAVGMPAEFVEGMRQAPFWAGLEAVAHTLAYDAAIMGDTMSGNPLPEDRWSKVEVPVLVAGGGNSLPWITNGGNDLTRVLADTERVILEGQDHGAAPEVVAPVLKQFFV